MKIGSFHIEFYKELLVPQAKFHALNAARVCWYPAMDLQRANAGWVWFDSPREYRRAKRILRS